MLGSEEHKQIIATKVYATHVILFVVREKNYFASYCNYAVWNTRKKDHQATKF